MIRATIGAWLNYATTLAFQVVFARHFGVGADASAFVIAFGLAIAIGGMFNSTVQSVVTPRLMAGDAVLVRGAVRFLVLVAIVAAVLCSALVAGSGALASLLAGPLGLDAGLFTVMLRLTGGVLLLVTITCELMTVALATGRRFVPAFANAIPSLMATLLLLASPSAGVQTMYAWFLGGLVVETVFLVAALPRPLTLAAGQTPRIGVIAAVTLGQFALTAMIAPLEGVIASLLTTGGAAAYYLAIRSLAVAQSLLIGGVALAALADWSRLMHRGDRHGMARSLLASSVLGGLVLVAAASIAAVSGRALVALVYGHGAVSDADVTAVARLLLLALPGFCAEGLAIIMSRGLAASRDNRTAVLLGLTTAVIRIVLAAACGLVWGPPGLAVAYSLAWMIAAAVQAAMLRRRRLLLGNRRVVGRSCLVASATAASAVLLAVAAPAVPALVSGVLVAAVFAALCVGMWPAATWSAVWQR